MGTNMERGKRPQEEGKGERAWRFLRDFNAIGAVALGGLAVIAPVGAGILAAGASLNAAQVGAYEVFRRRAKKSRMHRES